MQSNECGLDERMCPPFWVAEHGPVRPHERSLEPLTGTDGCGTMMDNLVDDDAGETSAVRSQIQPVKPSDQEIATHEACGHCPYRDWYRACVGVTGRTLTNDGMKNKTVCLCEHGLWVLHRWGDDGEKTRGATPFLMVKVKPSMMIWSMLVQCEGVDDQAAIKETVESLNRLGHPELIVRSDMVGNVLKQIKGYCDPW